MKRGYMWCEKITVRMLRVFIVCLMIGLSWGCTAAKPTPDRSPLITKLADEATIPKVPERPRVMLVTGPVVTVYGRAISPRWMNMRLLSWRKDVLDRIDRLDTLRHSGPRHQAHFQYYVRSVFEQLAHLHYEEMLLNKLKVTLSAEEKKQAVARYKVSHLVSGYDKQVRLWGDEAKLLGWIYHQARLRKLVMSDTIVKVNPKEVERRMPWLRGHSRRRHRVEASHILFRIRGKRTDRDAYKLALNISQVARKPGADFAALAKVYSEGPSARRGGYLGFFTKGSMVRSFARAAFGLKPGQVSSPVKTHFGYHVIKVISVIKPRRFSEKELKAHARVMIEDEAFTQVLFRMQQQWPLKFDLRHVRVNGKPLR